MKNQGQRSFFRILMGLALTAQAERPLKERVSLEGSARKFWQFEINPGIPGPVSDQKWHFSQPFSDLTSKKLFVNIRLRFEHQQKNFLKSASNLVISFLFIWNWNVINTFIRRRFRENPVYAIPDRTILLVFCTETQIFVTKSKLTRSATGK